MMRAVRIIYKQHALEDRSGRRKCVHRLWVSGTKDRCVRSFVDADVTRARTMRSRCSRKLSSTIFLMRAQRTIMTYVL